MLYRLSTYFFLLFRSSSSRIKMYPKTIPERATCLPPFICGLAVFENRSQPIADRFATDSCPLSPTLPLIPWTDAGRRSGGAAWGLDGTTSRPGRGSQASKGPDGSRKEWCGAAWPPTSATSRSPLPAFASPWRDDFETRSSPVTMTGKQRGVCY